MRVAVRWLLVALVFGSAARAVAQVSDPDREAIQAVILAQVEAFERDDAEAAFGFAAPGIQAKFGSPEQFMSMVRGAYAPVYRPRTFAFRELDDGAAIAVQAVYVIGPDGVAYLAHYPMQKQSDGSWRIAGCTLVALPDESA